MGIKSLLKKYLVSPDLDRQLDQMVKPVGSLGYDPWGFNADAHKIAYSLFYPIYKKYFRVESHGIENVPGQGRVLLIANHSGQLPIDGVLIGFALSERKQEPRLARAMIERFFPTVPILGNVLNQLGGVLGDPTNCGKMLQNDEVIMVFPEGVRGSGKPYRERYQLKRFGNGFMHLAMKYNTPIVPVGVVGCEETIPAFADIKPLARLLGLPYVPVALPFIFPAKVILNFGKPMYFSNEELTEDEVTMRVEKVKSEINTLIRKGLDQREAIFS
jgi:1-acyl-sn-glycerol-3-phosphate acyltransferase